MRILLLGTLGVSEAERASHRLLTMFRIGRILGVSTLKSPNSRMDNEMAGGIGPIYKMPPIWICMVGPWKYGNIENIRVVLDLRHPLSLCADGGPVFMRLVRVGIAPIFLYEAQNFEIGIYESLLNLANLGEFSGSTEFFAFHIKTKRY